MDWGGEDDDRTLISYFNESTVLSTLNRPSQGPFDPNSLIKAVEELDTRKENVFSFHCYNQIHNQYLILTIVDEYFTCPDLSVLYHWTLVICLHTIMFGNSKPN